MTSIHPAQPMDLTRTEDDMAEVSDNCGKHARDSPAEDTEEDEPVQEKKARKQGYKTATVFTWAVEELAKHNERISGRDLLAAMNETNHAALTSAHLKSLREYLVDQPMPLIRLKMTEDTKQYTYKYVGPAIQESAAVAAAKAVEQVPTVPKQPKKSKVEKLSVAPLRPQQPACREWSTDKTRDPVELFLLQNQDIKLKIRASAGVTPQEVHAILTILHKFQLFGEVTQDKLNLMKVEGPALFAIFCGPTGPTPLFVSNADAKWVIVDTPTTSLTCLHMK